MHHSAKWEVLVLSLGLVFLAGYRTQASAQTWTSGGYQHITYLAAGYGSDQIQITIAPSIGAPPNVGTNPSGCNSTSANGWYVTDPNGIPSKILNATLLLAYHSKRRVQLYIANDCLHDQARILAVSVEP
jgi:hypothetical protein